MNQKEFEKLLDHLIELYSYASVGRMHLPDKISENKLREHGEELLDFLFKCFKESN